METTTEAAVGTLDAMTVDPSRFMKEFLEATRECFVSNGEYQPMAIVIGMRTPEGQELHAPGAHLIMANEGMTSEDAKNKFSAFMRDYCVKTAAFAVIFASEAWQVKAQPGVLDELVNIWGGRFHDHPDREECLRVTLDHVRFGFQSWTAKIIRTGDKPTLGEWEFHTGQHAGRFATFLQPIKASVN